MTRRFGRWFALWQVRSWSAAQPPADPQIANLEETLIGHPLPAAEEFSSSQRSPLSQSGDLPTWSSR
jgi:hypothetical protein